MYTMQMGWGFRRHHTNLSLHVSVIHYTVNYNVVYRSVRYGKHSLRYFRSYIYGPDSGLVTRMKSTLLVLKKA